MRIAQAAQQVGISISTLKRLEKRGLIRVRKDRNGQRRYTDRDIEQIQALYYPHFSRGLSGSNPARLPGGVRVTGSSTSSPLLPERCAL